jgi:transposase
MSNSQPVKIKRCQEICCPHCGGIYYLELSLSCPHCGQVFYADTNHTEEFPDDDD